MSKQSDINATILAALQGITKRLDEFESGSKVTTLKQNGKVQKSEQTKGKKSINPEGRQSVRVPFRHDSSQMRFIDAAASKKVKPGGKKKRMKKEPVIEKDKRVAFKFVKATCNKCEEVFDVNPLFIRSEQNPDTKKMEQFYTCDNCTGK